MNWPFLWTLMFAVMLTLFAGMAVLGTVFGARDIRRLMKHLRHPEDEARMDSDPRDCE